MEQHLKHDALIATAKTAPAITGAGYSFLTLNEGVAICTIGYILIQALILLHKHYYFVKEKRKK